MLFDKFWCGKKLRQFSKNWEYFLNNVKNNNNNFFCFQLIFKKKEQGKDLDSSKFTNDSKI